MHFGSIAVDKCEYASTRKNNNNKCSQSDSIKLPEVGSLANNWQRRAQLRCLHAACECVCVHVSVCFTDAGESENRNFPGIFFSHAINSTMTFKTRVPL